MARKPGKGRGVAATAIVVDHGTPVQKQLQIVTARQRTGGMATVVFGSFESCRPRSDDRR